MTTPITEPLKSSPAQVLREVPSPLADFLALTDREELLDPTLQGEALEPDEELTRQVRLAYHRQPPAPVAGQATALRVLNMIAQPKVSIQRLSQLVNQDAALSAGLLRRTQTVTTRGAMPIETVRDALVRLGEVEVARTTGAIAARSLFQPELRNDLRWLRPQLDAGFIDAVVTARIGSEIAAGMRGVNGDQLYLGALLHDVGRPVALRCLGVLTAGRGRLPAAVVDAVVEAVHVELGVETHRRFDLPQIARSIAAEHHQLNPSQAAGHRELRIVQLVSSLVRSHREPGSIAHSGPLIDAAAIALKLDGRALRALDTRIKEDLASQRSSLAA